MTKRLGAVLLHLGVVICGAATADAQSGNSYEGTLWAGQHIDSGTYVLSVGDDCGSLMVQFFPENDWKITEYHVDIVSSPVLFPTNRPGNPKIGHFQWKASFPPTTSDKFFYVFPTEVVDPVICGQLIDVAIHTVMVQTNGSGDIVREESAWGGPSSSDGWDPSSPLPTGFSEFPGPRWDYYLTFLWEGAPTPTPTPIPPTPTATVTPTPIPPTPTATVTPTQVPPTPTATVTPTPIPPTPTATATVTPIPP